MTEMDGQTAARIARQQTNTEQDKHIRRELGNLLTTNSSKRMVEALREEIAGFFTKALAAPENSGLIFDSYKELLPKLSEISSAKIKSGKENLSSLGNEKGIIVVTNHLGLGVLTILDNTDHKYPVDLPEVAPFPVRLTALQLIAEETGGSIYETAIEMPEPLLQIQKATKTILVPISGEGRTERLIADVKDVISSEPQKPVNIVMYPEGGTSGKRNNGSPYDLDTFHSGAFVVAAELGLPILPVCQFLSPEEGLELHVLNPIWPKKDDLPNIGQKVEDVKTKMQSCLNNLQSK